MAKVQYYTCPKGHKLAPTSDTGWSLVQYYLCETCGKPYPKLQLLLKLLTV